MSKIGYSIGEVAQIVGVQAHTIRFWCEELSQYVSPQIGNGGRRYFTESDVNYFKEVHKMITEKGYRLSMIKKNTNFEKNASSDVNSKLILEKIILIENRINNIITNL